MQKSIRIQDNKKDKGKSLKREFDIMRRKYYDTFGKNYPLQRTGGWNERDVIEDIKKCIETGTETKCVVLKKGMVY